MMKMMSKLRRRPRPFEPGCLIVIMIPLILAVIAAQTGYILHQEEYQRAQDQLIHEQSETIVVLVQERAALFEQAGRARARVQTLEYQLNEAQTEQRRVEHYLETKYRIPSKQANILTGYFQDAMERAEERYGVQLDLSVLAALTHTESRFQSQVVSTAGAVGIMQVMPRYHVHRYEFLESRQDLFVPKLNIRAGVFIFAEALKRYGSLRKAIRAYHGGQRGVTNPRPSTVAYEQAIFDRLSRLEV